MGNERDNKRLANKNNRYKNSKPKNNAKEKVVATKQNQQNFKENKNKKEGEFITSLANKFLSIVDCIEKTMEIIDEDKLNSIPDFVEILGVMSGLGYALENINKVFPLENYISKDKANNILSVVGDVDISDIDDGVIFDEI